MSNATSSAPVASGVIKDTNAIGAFVRKPSAYRDFVKRDGSTPFSPAKSRYILYVSYACPWACRTLTTRLAKGLQDVIAVRVVGPLFLPTRPDEFKAGTDQHTGWHISSDFDSECSLEPDAVFGAKTIRELYEKEWALRSAAETADREPPSRFTVPILVDAQTKRIVNNESSEIIRMLDAEFQEFAQNPSLVLYPPELAADIDAWNEKTYESYSNGVYKCGFATSQEAYDAAIAPLFATLEMLDAHLTSNRYLLGKRITEADVRLVQTMARHDCVYQQHFKVSRKCLREFRQLEQYMCDVVQTLNMFGAVNFSHIMRHYFCSHESINPFRIVPQMYVPDLKQRHGRENL